MVEEFVSEYQGNKFFRRFRVPSMSAASSIQSNLTRIRAHLKQISPRSVDLVAVSKLKPASDILKAYEAEQRHFGENYVSELVEKCTTLPTDIRWHFIGHLQSNKVTKLISSCPNLYMIETVDSEKLANKIELALKTAQRSDPLRVLVEVKTSSEESKSGLSISEVPRLVSHIRSQCPHLAFSGLMTIADESDAVASFTKLMGVKSALESEGVVVETVSMGMSRDFASAIQAGATQVRLGSSIFGAR